MLLVCLPSLRLFIERDRREEASPGLAACLALTVVCGASLCGSRSVVYIELVLLESRPLSAGTMTSA